MKAIFYDASATMLQKNHLPIVKNILEKKQNFISVFVSNEMSSNIYSDSNKICENNLLKVNNSSYVKLKTFKHNEISQFIKRERPNFVFIGAYRIYDQLITAICNKENINVYNIQHGFEIDSVNFVSSIILSRLKKGIRLLNASVNLGLISHKNPIFVSYQYIVHILGGKSFKNTLLDNPLFHPTTFFVYSEYYKDFWFNKYGLDKKKMSIITPPDFLMIDEISKQKKENGCCYIAQTLVEDGRLSEKEFIDFLSDYESIVREVDIFYIKLHPRSDRSYYKSLSEYSNVKIIDHFPNCSSYLTHYSSLIYTAAFFSKSIILHELKGHETDEIFKKVNPIICQSVDEIIMALKKDSVLVNEPSLEGRKEELKYFVSYGESDPYDEIYSNVMLKKG